MNRGYAAIGLFQPKIAANVGGAMRAAYCYDAKMIAIQGQRFKRHASDTTKAWRHTPFIQTDDLLSIVPYSCVPVAVEIVEGAIPLQEFEHPQRAFYIFGPEDGTLHNNILEHCPFVVKIPTVTCMNLAATVNVVLYDRVAKQLMEERAATNGVGHIR